MLKALGPAVLRLLGNLPELLLGLFERLVELVRWIRTAARPLVTAAMLAVTPARIPPALAVSTPVATLTVPAAAVSVPTAVVGSAAPAAALGAPVSAVSVPAVATAGAVATAAAAATAGTQTPAFPIPQQPKEQRRRGAYPICWPKDLLPDPQYRTGLFQAGFVRVKSADRGERDTYDAWQHRLQLRWRQQIDPGFIAKDYHVHHLVPLFLGGPDWLQVNGITWPARPHLHGHEVLRRQRQLTNPMVTAPLPPINEDLYDEEHKSGTLYYFAGYKGFGPICGAS